MRCRSRLFVGNQEVDVHSLDSKSPAALYVYVTERSVRGLFMWFIPRNLCVPDPFHFSTIPVTPSTARGTCLCVSKLSERCIWRRFQLLSLVICAENGSWLASGWPNKPKHKKGRPKHRLTRNPNEFVRNEWQYTGNVTVSKLLDITPAITNRNTK